MAERKFTARVRARQNRKRSSEDGPELMAKRLRLFEAPASVGQKRPSAQWPASFEQTAPNSDSATEPSRRQSLAVGRVESAFEECLAATWLVEVTLHSSESQDIACSEQEVLRHALKSIAEVRNCVFEQKLADLNGLNPATEGQR